jgi:hypothetical protein
MSRLQDVKLPSREDRSLPVRPARATITPSARRRPAERPVIVDELGRFQLALGATAEEVAGGGLSNANAAR